MSSTQVSINDIVTMSTISSPSCTYELENILGQGSFGTVLQAVRSGDTIPVAIKIMQKRHVFEASSEMDHLKHLGQLDPDQHNIVKWHEGFFLFGYPCLVLEKLDKSLFDMMYEQSFQPLPLNAIRPIIKQVAMALDHLKALKIIHTDIKADNIMLVDHAKEPYRVKLIDFGLACEVSKVVVGSCIQPQKYRSPEVILRAPYDEAIDMWSLGCVAAELYLGSILFPGTNEYEMMWYIVHTLDKPPASLLDSGRNTKRFFVQESSGSWILKTPDQYLRRTNCVVVDCRKEKIKSLNDLFQIQMRRVPLIPTEKQVEIKDLFTFMEMLTEMLHLDPSKRITPSQLLEHGFITAEHLATLYPLRSYVKSGFQMMEACQKRDTPHKVSPRSPQSDQNHHCATQSGTKTGIKRKPAHHEEEAPEAAQHEAPHKRKRLVVECTRLRLPISKAPESEHRSEKRKRTQEEQQDGGDNLNTEANSPKSGLKRRLAPEAKGSPDRQRRDKRQRTCDSKERRLTMAERS